jgi:hypothetical protein
MAQLEVVFSGLVSFVPFREGEISFAKVLFPAVDVATQVILSDGAFTMPKHRPRIRFEASQLADDNERKLDWYVDDLNGNVEYYIFLDQEDLSFITGNPDKNFTIAKNIAGPLDPKPHPDLSLEDYLKAKSDIKWVADMNRILPNNAQIDGDCINENCLNLIKVRIFLDDGDLATFRLAGGEEPDEKKPDLVDIYRFEIPDIERAYEQTLAEQVILRVPLEESRVIVSSFDREGNELSPLILEGETIRLYIENIDAESILVEGRRPLDRDTIDEVGIFYELCNRRPVTLRRVSPFKTGGGGGQRICPTCVFPEEIVNADMEGE